MDDILSWIYSYRLAIFILLIPIVSVMSLRRFTSVKRIFKLQALKRNGKISRHFMSYSLSFSYNDHYYTVSEYAGSRYHTPYSRIETKINKIVDHWVEISSESWVSEIGKKLGSQDIQIGISDFDDQFMIKGSDDLFVINFLTYNVQDKLLMLRRFKPKTTFENNRLIVNIPRVLKREEDYDLLIETAFALIDRLEER